MRQGQQSRRGRGRGRKPQNQLSRNLESNGPDVKIRGTASHIAEKYSNLARDALSSGDPVTAENFLQHAEHYYRIIMAAQPQQSGSTLAEDGANGAGAQRAGGENAQRLGGRSGDGVETRADDGAANVRQASEKSAEQAGNGADGKGEAPSNNGSATEAQDDVSAEEDASADTPSA